jgi:hypothetical protein
MSARRDELALRKQLVLARSTLYRTRLQLELLGMRGRVSRVKGRLAAGASILSMLRVALPLLSLLRRLRRRSR